MKSRYFKIGLFVIGAITIGVIGIIVFGAGKIYREKVTAETYVDESVQGLSVGSLVKRRGVEIGTVEEITFVPRIYEFDPTDPDYFQYARYVYIKIGIYKDWLAGAARGRFEDPRVALENEVANGLTVRLTPLGLTGVAYLEADYIDTEDVPTLKVAWIPETTYIPSAPGTLAALSQALHKVAKVVKGLDIKGIEADVKGLLQAATKEVKDLHIASIRARINRELDELLVTTQRVHEILEKPEVNEIIVNLRDTTKNATEATAKLDAILESDEVRKTLANLEVNTALLERTLRRVDNLVSSQQQDIEVIIQDVRLITDSLKELTGNAEKYPSQLIFGEPPPRSKIDNSK